MQHVPLLKMLLEIEFVSGLMKLVLHPDFDLSSDAFSSLRQLLLINKPVACERIADHAEQLLEALHELLIADAYFTQRQVLRLLGDLLLDPCFECIVPAYVCSDKYLKVQMNLLREESKTLQHDAFRVFSIFVDHPETSPRVHMILYKNKDRLVRLLDSLTETIRVEDANSARNPRMVVEAIEALSAPSRRSSFSSTGSPKFGMQPSSMDPPALNFPDKKTSPDATDQAAFNDYAVHLIQCVF